MNISSYSSAVSSYYAPVNGLPQGGGESGIPTGFDNYLFPLGREFDDSTRPEGREDCQVSVMSERMVTQVY